MRILMLDLDTLRPDHLGCYGYMRNTSPNIDRIAADGMRFTNCHCSDAPCLPSRSSLVTGQFGIHSGVVGHGGTAADMRLYGRGRDFRDPDAVNNLFHVFRKAGLRTVSVSPFAERHSSFWFYSGFEEMVNTGRGGGESAEEIQPAVMDWLGRNADREDWFLHVNFWDPHTPYRAPASFGNPFEDDPLPGWLTPETLAGHRRQAGPHSARDLNMFDDAVHPGYPRMPGKIEDLAGLRRVIDGYDCGIRYMDDKIGEIVDFLKRRGLYDDMAIIVTSDHGENLGELGIYSEHATADEITTRVPMLVKWPGCRAGAADDRLILNLDLAPTMADLLSQPSWHRWDGTSYAPVLRGEPAETREYVVLSQCAHVCQRSVRFGDYLYIRTYHDGFHLFPDEMLFDIANDFHEQHNLAEARPDLCAVACRHLVEWHGMMMATSDSDADPMWTVIREGGPYHTVGQLDAYCRRLEQTDRAAEAGRLRIRHAPHGRSKS